MSWFSLWSQAVIGFLAYKLCLYLYRVYLSPLSRFPGPKLAAATSLYESYYDFVENGRYPWRMQEMHRQYGPVVRVNPREMHIRDPDYVDKLYQQRLNKDPWFSRSWGIPLAGISTWDHRLHRQRRSAINKFFSKASIASRVDLIEDKVLLFCETLRPFAASGEVVQIDAGFVCLTLDVIAEFSYGVSYKYLEVPGYNKEFKAMIENAFGAGAFNRQFPIVLKIMQALPIWLAVRLTPQVAGVLRLQAMVRLEAKRVRDTITLQEVAHTVDSVDTAAYYDTESAGISRKNTIFEQILDSGLPLAEKSEDRLVQEGQTLVAAGSETTSRALYVSVVHLLQQPPLLSRLRQELRALMPDTKSRPSLQQLEQLPFLTATIKESIRLGGSSVTRTARMSPSSHPLSYKDWVFPPGTPVSVTLFDVMMDENIFPRPETFNPMRWLVVDQSGGQEVLKANTALDKYFMPFSRGPRSCVGMWLAWAELYLAMAHVYRRFDMELFETSVEDVAAACDRFSCFAKPGNRGVRVKITALL